MDNTSENKETYVHNNHTLGVMTIVIGIIALVGSWIPYLNVISIIIAISGIIIGICATVKIFKKKCRGGILIANGVIFSVVAICLAVNINNSISDTFSNKSGFSQVTDNSNQVQQNASEDTNASTDSESTKQNVDSNETNSEQSPKSSGTKATLSQQNALKTANSYLESSAFSRSGLIKQLKFEKFSSEDATYAADNCGANWNEQAVKQAKSYLECLSFSAEGLIDQLKFDGFTQEQATYAIKSIGL